MQWLRNQWVLWLLPVSVIAVVLLGLAYYHKLRLKNGDGPPGIDPFVYYDKSLIQLVQGATRTEVFRIMAV